jgi:hypothetical protein
MQQSAAAHEAFPTRSVDVLGYPDDELGEIRSSERAALVSPVSPRSG